MHQEVTALKEAEALKDEFVSIATHELRTPLAALKGYADVLLRPGALAVRGWDCISAASWWSGMKVASGLNQKRVQAPPSSLLCRSI